MIKFLFIFLTTSLINLAVGAYQDVASENITPETAFEIKLRTTKAYSQIYSQLCWIFSTLNILEINYLESHPDITPDQVELSRLAYENFVGTMTRGTVVDAIYNYLPQFGLMMDSEYEKDGSLLESHFNNVALTPRQLATEILGAQKFWSYGFDPKIHGWYRHPDPDALSGTQSFFLDRSQMPKLIMESLKRRQALGLSRGGHSVTIYGADINLNNQAISYFIKDSYYPYFYKVSSDKVHNEGVVITTFAGFQD